MQLLAKFKQILYMGFSATLNFRKNSLPVLVSIRPFVEQKFSVTPLSQSVYLRTYWI